MARATNGWLFAAASLAWAGCKGTDGKDGTWEPPALVVNELLASNQTGILDYTGAFSDWFEIYNASDEIVDLSEYTATDDPALPQKWSFPDGVSVPAGGYLVVFASGSGSTVDEVHASFRLSRAGESILLVGPARYDLPVIDQVDFGPQQPDISWARMPDGAADFIADPTPTPGEPNG